MSHHSQAKALYCQGKSISDIATTLGLSRTTIYSYRHKDRAQGTDWDNLRFIKATDAGDAKLQEQDFLALLIFNFESALERINALEPDQQLKELTQYANTYYKLKMQRDNPKINQADLAKRVLHQVSQLALAKSADSVIGFLSDHADAIVTAVID